MQSTDNQALEGAGFGNLSYCYFSKYLIYVWSSSREFYNIFLDWSKALMSIRLGSSMSNEFI